MINISLGIILGIITTLFTIYVGFSLSENGTEKQKPQGPTIAEKLEIARQRIGQIAAQETVSGVRMIAKKAMKETG